MKKLLMVIIVLFLSHKTFAQCIILDLKLNDCVSCRNNLSILQELSAELPIFVIFSERQKVDSADLEHKFTLKDYGIKYIFNNNYYQKFHKKNQTSNWYLLNQNGDIAREGDLKLIDNNVFIDSVRQIVSILPAITYCHYNFTKDKIYLLIYDLDKLQILKKSALQHPININPRDFKYKYIQESLKGNDSIAFAEKGEIINTKVKGFRPGFKWFDINPSGECYAMMEYLHPFLLNSDTISYKIHTCLVKYDSSGKIIKTFPVNLDSLDKYDNYCHRFVLKNDYSFVAITHPPLNWFQQQIEANPDRRVEFVTEYIIGAPDGTVKPVKYYPLDLPPIYKKKYFENFMSPELSSFPYITFRYANELYNLNTLASCSIVDAATYNEHTDFSSVEIGDDKYAVLATKTLLRTKETLVVYRLKNDIYIKSFNDLKETRLAYVGNILRGNNVENCFIDPYSEQIYFSFENEANNIAIPLSLYGF